MNVAQMLGVSQPTRRKPIHWLSQMILTGPTITKKAPVNRGTPNEKDAVFMEEMGKEPRSMHDMCQRMPQVHKTTVKKLIARLEKNGVIWRSQRKVYQEHSSRPVFVWSVK